MLTKFRQYWRDNMMCPPELEEELSWIRWCAFWKSWWKVLLIFLGGILVFVVLQIVFQLEGIRKEVLQGVVYGGSGVASWLIVRRAGRNKARKFLRDKGYCTCGNKRMSKEQAEICSQCGDKVSVWVRVRV